MKIDFFKKDRSKWVGFRYFFNQNYVINFQCGFHSALICTVFMIMFEVLKRREQMLNVGIIGLGHMGRLHMMNCLHVDGVKIVSAADSSKRTLKKAKLVGVKNLYMNYHDLLNGSPNLDAVVISLPNFLHFDSVQLALEAGLDVFVEKPLANTVGECRKIVKLVEKSGRKFMVGHCMRFIDAIEKMKDTADRGRIGDLEVVTIEQILNGPFAIDYVLLQQNFSLVQNVSINGMVFPVNCTSSWDSDRNGFYYQMFFELWLYNMTSSNFQYHNRFVDLWLNMTGS